MLVGHKCPTNMLLQTQVFQLIVGFKSLQGRLKTQNLVFRRPFPAKIPIPFTPKIQESPCRLPPPPSSTANLPTNTASAAVSLVKTACRLIRFLLKSAARRRARSRLPWCWKTRMPLPPAVLCGYIG